MAFSQDLRVSARRHLRSADELYELLSAGSQPGCKAVAGYLFGLCGELAVKAMMEDSGMRKHANRRDDPYFAHFPELKTLLRDNARGRRAGVLRLIAENDRLFQHWDTEMRYAPTLQILTKWVVAWKASAHELIAKMEAE